jgi:opacity protein-like surface antigen
MTHRRSQFVLAVALVVLSGSASAQQAVPESEGLAGPKPSAFEGTASRGNPAPAGGAVAQQGAIEIGLRVAYAIPFGTQGTAIAHRIDTKLSDEIKGMIPIEIDAGYRITPRFYVGLSFQYGFAFVNTSTNPECAGDPRFSPTGQSLSCSSRDLRFGANAQVHLAPGHSFDPWLGLGVGYEWLSFDVSGPLINATVDAAASGLEFANFQLGGDIAVARNVAVGPFMRASLGHYRSVSYGYGVYSPTEVTNEALHEWLEFGLRGAFDINF